MTDEEAWERAAQIEETLDTIWAWWLHAEIALIVKGEERTEESVRRMLTVSGLEPSMVVVETAVFLRARRT